MMTRTSTLLFFVSLLFVHGWAFPPTKTITSFQKKTASKLYQSTRAATSPYDDNSRQRHTPRRHLLEGQRPPQQTAVVPFADISSSLVTFLHRHCWRIPLTLCLVPVLTQVLYSTWPSTPSWWKLVPLQTILQTHGGGNPVIVPFLASNGSFLISAGLIFPMSKTVSGWTICAGCISTLFHATQVFHSSYALAEALCFIDHGIAITATLYVWKRYGLPTTVRAWALGAAALTTLCIPAEWCPSLYVVFHSLWHVLSAATGVVWVKDNHENCKRTTA